MVAHTPPHMWRYITCDMRTIACYLLAICSLHLLDKHKARVVSIVDVRACHEAHICPHGIFTKENIIAHMNCE